MSRNSSDTCAERPVSIAANLEHSRTCVERFASIGIGFTHSTHLHMLHRLHTWLKFFPSRYNRCTGRCLYTAGPASIMPRLMHRAVFKPLTLIPSIPPLASIANRRAISEAQKLHLCHATHQLQSCAASNKISCNPMQCSAIPCNPVQSHAVPCNPMRAVGQQVRCGDGRGGR